MALAKKHEYTAAIRWTGNRGEGTRGYKAYDRSWNVATPDKQVIHCSNDPLLGGDAARHNPEDLLLASLSSCHMLWYLHLCAVAGVVVEAYRDEPLGIGEVAPDGSGRFLSATLRPKIRISAGSDWRKAHEIHGEIHKYCFIARSVSFPVTCEPEIEIGS